MNTTLFVFLTGTKWKLDTEQHSQCSATFLSQVDPDWQGIACVLRFERSIQTVPAYCNRLMPEMIAFPLPDFHMLCHMKDRGG